MKRQCQFAVSGKTLFVAACLYDYEQRDKEKHCKLKITERRVAFCELKEMKDHDE